MIMKKIALLLCGIVVGTGAMAQIPVTGSSLTYMQDFNGLDITSTNSSNLPSGWEIFEYGTSANVNNQYKGDAGTSNGGDTYSYGSAGAAERALGSLASNTLSTQYGAKFINNTGTTITSLTISYQGEQWRFGGSAAPRVDNDSLRFLYSTTATGVSDTTAANWSEDYALLFTGPNITAATGSLDGNLAGNNTLKTAVISVTVNPGSTLIIKWVDKNIAGTDDGLAIDDLSITFATGTPLPPNYHPNIIALNPSDNSTNVLTTVNSLQIVFDRGVSAGTGNVTIKNETDQTTQTIAVSSANTTVSGNTATITGMNLLQGKSYHVTFDSTAFDTAGYRGVGIYDSTDWNFSTAAPPPPAATSLNENFDASCPAGLPAGWTAQSVAGTQTWGCGGTGNNGNNGTKGLQMNGYQGGNNANEDWLITPQLDLSAMTNAYFRFDHWKRFISGDELQVLVSNDYSGSGAPDAATWINLNVIAPAPADTGVWKTFETNITAHKSQPIYLAFKYVSTTADGYQSRLDNVLVSATPTSVAHVSKESLDFYVSGNATNHDIILGLNVKAGNYKIEVCDLVGREVYNTSTFIGSGTRQIAVSGLNLTSGMYIIKLRNDRELSAVKFIVE